MSKHVNTANIKQLVGCTLLFWNVRRKLRTSKRVEELYNKVYWDTCVCLIAHDMHNIVYSIKHFTFPVLFYLSYFKYWSVSHSLSC
jgi:hypothetical protein